MKSSSKMLSKFSKKTIYVLRLLFFLTSFLLLSFPTFSQDSIPEKKDISQEKSMQFQEFFFKALSEKSIENYQKAIENLESCNQILENQVAVYFEFSKNYFFLNNTLLAKEYIQRALQKEPENIWMLKHLVSIYERESNFTDAITTQQKVCEINPKEKEPLVRLYFLNNQFKEAISLIDILEEEASLSNDLKFLRDRLKQSKVPDVKEIKLNDLEGLLLQFQTDKSYKILEQILQKSEKTLDTLLKYSTEGISLFPAQPFVYLQNGIALNSQNEFKKALVSLKNGLDFVIDEQMEANFYTEIAKAYKGLGNATEEKKYLQKASNLKS